MIRRLVISPLSWVLVAGIAVFAAAAGFQLGGGELPGVPTVSNELLYIGTATLLGLGVFGLLLRRPDVIGRIAPTVYVVVALLPLLRFDLPGIDLIRFLPLLLLAPVVYSLYRDAEPITSHTKVSRIAVFAAFATIASSLIANRETTDLLRLLLMGGGIVLLVGAAPRAWSASWRESVEKAVSVAFVLIVSSSVLLLPLSASFQNDRLRGAWESPNTLGALLALTTPLAASRSRFAGFYWVVAFALSIASGSRGGLLALSVAAVVVLLYKRRFVQLFALFVLALIVLSTGVVRTQADHEQTFGVNTRQLVWDDVYGEFRESPLTGFGFGAVDDFEYSPEVQRWVGSSPQTHSSWLDGLYEQGVLGIIPWAVALLFGVVAATRAGPTWAAVIVAGLVSATFESWMFAIGGGIGSLYWLIFGAASLGLSNTGEIAQERPLVGEVPPTRVGGRDHVRAKSDHGRRDQREVVPAGARLDQISAERREVPSVAPFGYVPPEGYFDQPSSTRDRKVVVSVKSFPPAFRSGGPGRSVESLVEALHQEAEFRVITSLDDNGYDLRRDGVVPVTWMRRAHTEVSAIPRGLRAPVRIVRQVRQTRPDVLYLNSLFHPVFSLTLLAARRLGLIGLESTIVAPRGELDPGALGLNHSKKRVVLGLLRRSGLINGVSWHATSADEAGHIRREFGEDSDILVASNVRTGETPHPSDPPHGERIRIVFMSKIDRKKNLETAVEAVARCEAATLTVFGPIKDERYWSEVLDRVESSGLCERFEYKGLLSPDSVIERLAEFDLFILPTRGENFGHAIFESLAAGVPVLLSEHTPWSRVGELGAGWIHPADSPEAYALSIRGYEMLDAAQRRGMRAAAAAVATEHLDDPEPLIAHRRLLGTEARVI